MQADGDVGRSTEILRYRGGHRVALHHEGAVVFGEMEAAIAAAVDHVHLETYILRTDGVGTRLLDALAERARAGVAVRVVYDALGSRGLDATRVARYAAEGIEFAEFNPPSRWFWRFRPRRRDHRKLLLVDGRVAFLGGLNIGDEYASGGPDGRPWRDAHLGLEGPQVAELEALFVESWFRSGGSSFDWRKLVATESEADGDASVAILADGPSYRRRRVRDFFVDELQHARSRVLLVSPYFAPGARVLDALAAARDRGVEIDLVLAGHTDHPILRRAARAICPRLVRHGVRVYEESHAMVHAKLAAFDDRIAVVGTSNLDRQSLQHSCEVNAVFAGSDVPKWIHEHFGPDGRALDPVRDPREEARRWLDPWLDRWATFWAQL